MLLLFWIEDIFHGLLIYFSWCLCITALQCHYEVHQSASLTAQCTHAQPHCERAQLDGLSPGVLPWLTGQGYLLKTHSHLHPLKYCRGGKRRGVNKYKVFHLILYILFFTGFKRGSETSYWDSWDALSSHQTAQVSSRGILLSLLYLIAPLWVVGKW